MILQIYLKIKLILIVGSGIVINLIKISRALVKMLIIGNNLIVELLLLSFNLHFNTLYNIVKITLMIKYHYCCLKFRSIQNSNPHKLAF